MGKLKKVHNVYKNQGLKGLAEKSQSYAANRLRTKKVAPQSLEEKSLREEYDLVANEIFMIKESDIQKSKKACEKALPKKISTALWFVPYYEHFGFNGIQTIFRTMEKLNIEGVKCFIVIYDRPTTDVNKMANDIAEYFPNLTNYEFIVLGDNKLRDMAKLPESDIAFCTMWVSAYFLLKYNKTKRKFYFIQDYEPLFYVAGATYALAESTYRFDFKAIVNTPGLYNAVRDRHSMDGMAFVPSVNRALYYEAPHKKNKAVRIFFYARPNNPRNAFNLGVLTIQKLLKKYGDKIEIVTAGAPWDESEYGLSGKITNLGLISTLTGVAELYRTCDIGFAYMMNKHTTYQMMEYAASGMATVMNKNEDHLWLHKDGENCLLAEPSPAAMAEKIGLLVEDPGLRTKIVAGAKSTLEHTWDEATEQVWSYIQSS